jgi:hypothetical protein
MAGEKWRNLLKRPARVGDASAEPPPHWEIKEAAPFFTCHLFASNSVAQGKLEILPFLIS